jgi:hypothetical protein
MRTRPDIPSASFPRPCQNGTQGPRQPVWALRSYLLARLQHVGEPHLTEKVGLPPSQNTALTRFACLTALSAGRKAGTDSNLVGQGADFRPVLVADADAEVRGVAATGWGRVGCCGCGGLGFVLASRFVQYVHRYPTSVFVATSSTTLVLVASTVTLSVSVCVTPSTRVVVLVVVVASAVVTGTVTVTGLGSRHLQAWATLCLSSPRPRMSRAGLLTGGQGNRSSNERRPRGVATGSGFAPPRVVSQGRVVVVVVVS